MDAINPQNSAYKSLIISLIWDIALNATIPVLCYFLVKRFVSPSELIALIFATAFPLLKSAYDIRRRELDPVAVLVLLGIVTSILAVFLGGDPRILLIRESFFTGAFGVACLVSLILLPRPIMFYFSRFFMAGKDPQKREIFNARWQNPIVRRAHRLITLVWGLVYVGEFLVRIILVYSLPASVVLIVSPFMIGFATIFTIIWSFWYAKKIRERISP